MQRIVIWGESDILIPPPERALHSSIQGITRASVAINAKGQREILWPFRIDGSDEAVEKTFSAAGLAFHRARQIGAQLQWSATV